MDTLRVGDQSYSIYRLDSLQSRWDVVRLPYTLRILLENVLRNGSEADQHGVDRATLESDDRFGRDRAVNRLDGEWR